MSSTNLTLRVSNAPDFKAYAVNKVIVENTTLLDHHHSDANGDVVLHGWSPETITFWMTLLHSAGNEVHDLLGAFNVTIQQLWSIVSFYELYVRPKKDRDLATVQQERVTAGGGRPGAEGASVPTMRLRRWFGDWRRGHGVKIREVDAAGLAMVVMPAFYVGDARVFMDVTHEWFLHTAGRQSSVGVHDVSDESGKGTLAIDHPLLGKLAAVRSNPSRPGPGPGKNKPKVCQDPDWCPKEKTAAYYTALMATGCWPVGDAMKDKSVYQILRDLQGFDYVPYCRVKHLHDQDAARAKMPREEDVKDTKDTKDGSKRGAHADKQAPSDKVVVNKTSVPCNVCIDATVKASFDRKVRSLFKNLLDEKQTTVRKVSAGEWVYTRMDDSFKGLCLDCFTRTKFDGEGEDEDYWNHCHNFEFDYGCTVKHGQPTWYFSYMGRPEALQEWAK